MTKNDEDSSTESKRCSCEPTHWEKATVTSVIKQYEEDMVKT